MSNCLTSLLLNSEQWFYGNRSVNDQQNHCNYHVCPSVLAPHFWQCCTKMSFIGLNTIIADLIANINGSTVSVEFRQIIID